MGKVLLLAILVAAGWHAWGKLGGSPAAQTYEDFALAWAKVPAASELSDERTARAAIGPNGPSNLMPYPIGYVHGADHEIESELRSGPSVEITAVQTIRYDPPGRIGISLPMPFGPLVTAAVTP
jgi:hypothetical protein